MTALLGSEPPPEVGVTKETVFTIYRSFKRLTKQPHFVAPLTAVLCIAPAPAIAEREKRATGPHYRTFIHVYVNGLADETITGGRATFPPGAVIVKEKLIADGSVARTGGPVSGVAGMIKRAPGFDPKNGDWEYFYSDKIAELSTGRLQNCGECHSNAKSTDYVFSVWKPFD